MGESGKDCRERERERRKGERGEKRMRATDEARQKREARRGRERWRGQGKRDPERQVKAGGRGVGGRAGFRDAIERRIWRKVERRKREEGSARARRKKRGRWFTREIEAFRGGVGGVEERESG